MRTIIVSRSEIETDQIAFDLARRITSGSIVLLFGGMGAGKTVFVRGLVRGINGDPDEVSSPTFTLIQEYRGTNSLYHVDLYRLESHEVDDLGLEDLTGNCTILAIEWADKLPRAIDGAIEVFMNDKGKDDREIVIMT